MSVIQSLPPALKNSGRCELSKAKLVTLANDSHFAVVDIAQFYSSKALPDPRLVDLALIQRLSATNLGNYLRLSGFKDFLKAANSSENSLARSTFAPPIFNNSSISNARREPWAKPKTPNPPASL